MKIEIEIPDWCDERNIYVLAGIELAAYKDFNEDVFHIKTSRCIQCGKCCRDLRGKQYPLKENKDCLHLDEFGKCSLGATRPLPCCEGDPVKGKWGRDFCSIRYDGDKK